MAQVISQLPCDCDGVCMLCKTKPSEEELLSCKTCATQWHVACLSTPPATMAETVQWECPDCSTLPSEFPPAAVVGKGLIGDSSGGDLMADVRAIEADDSLTEQEKAKKRQELLSGKAVAEDDDDKKGKKKVESDGKNVLDILSGIMNCSFCIQIPERPVTVISTSL